MRLAFAGMATTVALTAAPNLLAQDAGPAVGSTAPGWSLPVASRTGVESEPLTLESLEGRAVVLAFFPRARTSGCTVQMRTYRDRFAELFGEEVELIAVSNDPVEELASWAADEDFPFRFASDLDGVVGRAYGAFNEARAYERRFLYVIAPDGTVRAAMRPFAEIDPTSYDSLKATLAPFRGGD
jgi:peroxiredoxin Q/BCP